MHEVCEAAQKALTELGGATHYKALAEYMQSHKLWVSRGRTVPCDMVYFQIHKDMKQRGEASPFRLDGKGVFRLSTQEPGNLADLTPARKSGPAPEGGAPARRRKVEDEPACGKKCGNCLYIGWSGIQEARLEQGECDAFDRSGRIAVQASEPACEQWKRRSSGREDADRRRAANLVVLVKAVNRCVQSGRSYGSVDLEKVNQKAGK